MYHYISSWQEEVKLNWVITFARFFPCEILFNCFFFTNCVSFNNINLSSCEARVIKFFNFLNQDNPLARVFIAFKRLKDKFYSCDKIVIRNKRKTTREIDRPLQYTIFFMLICGYDYISLLQKEKQSFQLFIMRKTRPGISSKENLREFAQFLHPNNWSAWKKNLTVSSTWLEPRDITSPPRLISLKHRLKSGFRTEE